MEGGKCFLFQTILARVFGGCCSAEGGSFDGADEMPGIRRFEYFSLSAVGPNSFGSDWAFRVTDSTGG